MSKVSRYRFAQGLWVITAYYNPVGYRTRRENFEAFAEELRRRARESKTGRISAWPPRESLAPWTEPVVVEKIALLIENPGPKK